MTASRKPAGATGTRPGWDDSTLWATFADHARSDPTERAVVDREGERIVTRATLLADAEALAARFEAHGLAAGDVISVQLPNRYETVVVALASLRLGLVINTLLPNYRAKELEHIFGAASPKVVVVPATYRGFDHPAMVDGLQDSLPSDVLVIVVDDDEMIDAVRRDAETAPRPVAPLPAADRWSELIFSSGTEATPKGIIHSEQTTNAGVRALHDHLDLREDTVVWMPSPVGHSTGFNFGLRFALYHGVPLVLQDRWDAALAISLVRRFGASYTLAATTFLQDLVSELERRGETLAELTHFACGGAAVPPELVGAAADRGIGVLRLYGSTEALVVSCNQPGLPLANRLHTDGMPLPGVGVRTRDDAGADCPPGAAGEIEVQSPQNALGYFEDDARSRATFLEDNWVRSGDLGVLGSDGSLSIVGRKKEIIIRGGLNIAPREIEEMILTFAEVERCAVVGLDDDRLGERSCAFVTLRPEAALDLDEVVARLRSQGLATYKLPERLEILEEMPATASGKIRKHVLREQYS